MSFDFKQTFLAKADKRISNKRMLLEGLARCIQNKACTTCRFGKEVNIPGWGADIDCACGINVVSNPMNPPCGKYRTKTSLAGLTQKLLKEISEGRGYARLERCPYCGNKNARLDLDPWNGLWSVECDVYACDRMSVEYFQTADEAIEEWNRGAAE